MTDLATYDFVVNDEDEVMLLIYAAETEPSDPKAVLDPDAHSVELQRNDQEQLLLEDVPDSIFDSLADADKLLVCELAADAEEEKHKGIVRAYEADILD